MAKNTALPLLAGGAALLILSGKKPKKRKGSGSKIRWGVRISSKCKSIIVENAELFEDFMYGAYNELIEADPDLTVLQITDALFGDIAPQCSGFPEKPESVAVVEFYSFMARTVARFMLDDPRVKVGASDMIDEATHIAFSDWYKQWRQYPSSDVPETPSDQVSFSSDFSDYKIGSDWYSENIKPFTASMIAAGAGENVFEEYTSSHGVLVGNLITPIEELPQEEEAVDDFLDKLEESIDRALQELS